MSEAARLFPDAVHIGRVGKIAWHSDDDCEELRNFAHASTPRSRRVGKIARRRTTMLALPGNFAHPHMGLGVKHLEGEVVGSPATERGLGLVFGGSA
jgi:hypothetical protein